jgi:hypothetical protein
VLIFENSNERDIFGLLLLVFSIEPCGACL